MKFLPALPVLALFAGCVYAPMVSPDVLGPGQYSAGAGLYGTQGSRVLGLFGYSSIHGRYGLGGGYDMGFGYAYPFGVYVDGKRQLSHRPLSAFDLCLSVDRRPSTIADSVGERPDCWVVGLTPSVVAGTANLYGGAQVLVQGEMTSPRPAYYVFPGLIAGASYQTDENPFRIVPTIGVFLDPGLNRRPVGWLVTAGVAIMFDFGDLPEE